MKELIVVEGVKDAQAVKRAFPEADVFITHGWGLSQKDIELLQEANRRRGVIIFTDPDRAGETIRRRLNALLPGCRHAFIPRSKAYKKGKVGVEAAASEDVRNALARVRTPGHQDRVFGMEDLLAHGLCGLPGAAARRRRLGEILSIGYGNSKNFLWRLNSFGISRAEFRRALEQMEAERNGPDPTRSNSPASATIRH